MNSKRTIVKRTIQETTISYRYFLDTILSPGKESAMATLSTSAFVQIFEAWWHVVTQVKCENNQKISQSASHGRYKRVIM